jgi:hypothetical protein
MTQRKHTISYVKAKSYFQGYASPYTHPGGRVNTCDKVIEEIVVGVLGAGATAQENYFLRELLRNLVRMARTEYAAELREIVQSLRDDSPVDPAREATSRRLTTKLMSDLRTKSIRPRLGR